MAKAYMERIEALRQQYLNTRVDMDVYNAKYVTEGFKETEGQPWIIQKATGYARTCEKKQIYIQDHELLVGGVGFKPRAGILNPDSASGVIEKEVDTISTRPFDPFYLSEEGKKIYLEEVKDYWKNKCVLDRWRLMAPKDMETLRTNGIIFIDRKAVRGLSSGNLLGIKLRPVYHGRPPPSRAGRRNARRTGRRAWVAGSRVTGSGRGRHRSGPPAPGPAYRAPWGPSRTAPSS